MAGGEGDAQLDRSERMCFERFPELRGREGNCVVADLATGEPIPHGHMIEAFRRIAQHLGLAPDGRFFDGRGVELTTHRYADAVIDRFYDLGHEWWTAGKAAEPPRHKPRRGIVGGRR